MLALDISAETREANSIYPYCFPYFDGMYNQNHIISEASLRVLLPFPAGASKLAICKLISDYYQVQRLRNEFHPT